MANDRPTSYVTAVTAEQAESLETLLQSRGNWEFSPLAYARWKAVNRQEKVSVAAYTSGKLVVQGGGTADFVSFLLEPEILHTFTFGLEGGEAAEEPVDPHGGIDESEGDLLHNALTFSMTYAFSENFILPLSHDEVVHGKKTVIDKLWGTYEEKCAQLRTLYFYMYAHPGKKLNFMGNEIAHFREWDEKRELDWGLLQYPFHDAFQKYFASLSRLYATQPALYAGEYDPRCFEWVASESRDEGVYAWLRKGAGQTILCVMNTQNTAHKKFPLYLRFPAGAEELLNTEAPCWGGADKSKPKALHTTDGGVYGRDYTLTVDLPAMGGRMFRLTPEAPRPEAAQASARRAAAARRKAARTQNAKADAAAHNSKK